MKKLSNSNPFMLILIPVLFAFVMGVGYQFEQKAKIEVGQVNVKRSTSLFTKSVKLVKTVAAVTETKLW